MNMQEIFREIHEMVNARNRQEGEFTAKEYAAALDRTPSWARMELQKAMKIGVVSSRKTAVDGHYCVLYKRITES